VELLLVSLNLLQLLCQNLVFTLGLVKFLMEIVGKLLLLTSLVSYTVNFRLNLHNLVLLLFNEFLNRLESLITLLHTEQRFLPVLKQRFLRHNYSLDFDGSLLEGVTSSSCLFLLRNQLSLVKCLLFVKSFDFFVHAVNQ
jgi:hypothetical protein